MEFFVLAWHWLTSFVSSHWYLLAIGFLLVIIGLLSIALTDLQRAAFGRKKDKDHSTHS